MRGSEVNLRRLSFSSARLARLCSALRGFVRTNEWCSVIEAEGDRASWFDSSIGRLQRSGAVGIMGECDHFGGYGPRDREIVLLLMLCFRRLLCRLDSCFAGAGFFLGVGCRVVLKCLGRITASLLMHLRRCLGFSDVSRCRLCFWVDLAGFRHASRRQWHILIYVRAAMWSIHDVPSFSDVAVF